LRLIALNFVRAYPNDILIIIPVSKRVY